MENEILKKLDAIDNRIGALENRLGRVEALSVATSQKVVAMSPSKVQPSITPAPEMLKIEPLTKTGGFESYFGRWILGVVGLVSLLFGVSYFLKYAFEQNWISPTGRVLVGLLMGVVFVVLGEYIRRSQAKYAQILSSAGLGLLYLTTYSAYGYYELISAGTSFLFMTAVTIFGVFLSVRTDSREIASLTTAMGFFVPYLFGLKAASDFGYFIYALALNIGVLSVSFFKKWRQPMMIGFVGTVFNFSSWYGFYYSPDKLAIAIYALVVFYLIYLASTLAHKFIANEKSDQADLAILTLAPAWFFFELYNLLQPGSDTTLAFIAVGMSVGYIVLAYIFKIYKDNDKQFALFLGGISALFLTLAIPLMFAQNVITIAWAVEASLIAILGAVTGNDGLKRFSIGIFILALVRFFALDNFNYYEDVKSWFPIFNKQFFTYLILIFSGTTIAYLFGHLMGEEYRSDARVTATLWMIVNLLTLFAVTSEIGKYFNQAGYNFINQKNAAISVFWTLYGGILLLLGIVAHNSYLRKSALALFGVTIFKVFIFDLSGLETPYRIISFMVLGIILLVVSYLYFKHQKNIETVTL
ncbi:MAG: DUF2339 domain-containing protein [bacterium]|nr:DUF2339 domain-containing protein [bacterium]